MEEKNQNIEEKKDLTQEEIEDVQGGSCPAPVIDVGVKIGELEGDIPNAAPIFE